MIHKYKDKIYKIKKYEIRNKIVKKKNLLQKKLRKNSGMGCGLGVLE